MFSEISNFFLRAVNQLLALFYSLPVVGGSYGVAIILLTVAVMIALMPLTLRATRSTIKMTQLQPKLKELQKEYKDDRATLNQEMMALYQSEGINPVGGCLPMLAQMPVFLILFNVLRGLARREADRPYFAIANRAKEMAGYTTTDGQNFDPSNLDHTTQLYTDLSNDTEMDFLGLLDLGQTASNVISDSVLTAIPYLILIVFVVATSYYQQRQIQARRGDQAQEMTPQQQTQQQLLRILPLMSGVWSFAFPAGLVLYWATSNLFRIGQQSYITRSLYSGDAPGAQLMRQQAEDAERKRKDKDSADKDNADKTSSDGASVDKTSADKTSSNGASVDKTSSDGASVDKTSSDGASVDTHSVDKNSVDKNGVDKHSVDKNSVDNHGGSRAEQWQRMRKQHGRASASRTGSNKGTTKGGSKGATKAVEASSRVTPKGTKPPSTAGKKKNRKRR